MKDKQILIKIDKSIFACLIYFIWIFLLQMKLMVIPNFHISLALLGIVVLFFVIIYRVQSIVNIKYSYKKLMLELLFLFISFLVSFHSTISSVNIFASSLMICFFNDVDENKLFKTFLVSSALTIFLTVLLCKLKILPNNIYVDGNYVRNSLGFIYASYGSTLVFYFTAIYIVVRKYSITYIELLGLMFLNIYFYKSTFTLDPFIFGMLLIIFSFFEKLLKISRRITNISIFKFFITNIFPFSFVFLIFLMYFSPRDIFFKINTLVSGRLDLSVRAMQTYGISLLGTKLPFSTLSSSSYFYVDSFYIQTLLLYGVVFFVIIMMLFTVAMKNAIHKKHYFLTMVLVAVALESIFDPQALWLWYSPVGFVLGKWFCTKESI